MMIKGMNTVIVTVIKDTIITALLITKYTILTVSIVVLVVTSALLIINYALLTKRSDRQGQASRRGHTRAREMHARNHMRADTRSPSPGRHADKRHEYVRADNGRCRRGSACTPELPRQWRAAARNVHAREPHVARRAGQSTRDA